MLFCSTSLPSISSKQDISIFFPQDTDNCSLSWEISQASTSVSGKTQAQKVDATSQGEDEEREGRTITCGHLHLRVISASFLQEQSFRGKKRDPLVNICSIQLENYKVQVFIRAHRNIRVPSAFLCSPCRESTVRNAWGWSELVFCPQSWKHNQPSLGPQRMRTHKLLPAPTLGIVQHFPQPGGPSSPAIWTAFYWGRVNQGYAKTQPHTKTKYHGHSQSQNNDSDHSCNGNDGVWGDHSIC